MLNKQDWCILDCVVCALCFRRACKSGEILLRQVEPCVWNGWEYFDICYVDARVRNTPIFFIRDPRSTRHLLARHHLIRCIWSSNQQRSRQLCVCVLRSSTRNRFIGDPSVPRSPLYTTADSPPGSPRRNAISSLNSVY